LREKLEERKIRFASETDTEVIVHLLAVHFGDSKNVLEALRRTVMELHGEYAIVFVTSHDADHLYGTRFKSPLGYGQVNGLAIIASDQRAIGPLTADMTFLEDGDVAVLSSSICALYNLTGSGTLIDVARPLISLPWAREESSLSGHKHYMIKEIYEAPLAAENVFKFNEQQLQAVVDDIVEKDLSITGAGSAFYVSQIGQYYFSQLADTYARTHPADEILSLVSFNGRDHLIAVSQSGETFDTLEIIRDALRNGSHVTSINNVYGSSSQRLATFPIFQGAGMEVCVLSTKSIISQSLFLYRLAKLLGKRNGFLASEEFADLSSAEKRFPEVLQQLLGKEIEDKIREVAYTNKAVRNWFFIGRGIHYPVAMEGALKFKEVSYRHAEGMPAGFFKHGTISLIDEDFYTIAFLPDKKTDEDAYRFTISNISEIHARRGNVIAIGHHEDVGKDIGDLYNCIVLPSVNRYLDPILELVAGQLLAYHFASFLNRDIDKPRALAKSVTVR
jgi:glucosamine--fructose-6-phosphate aminotransferase (isomerizing)